MCCEWDVDGLLEAIPASLFAEWGVHFEQEPWGHEVTNKQLAELCMLVAKFIGVRGAKAEDYMPKFTKRQKTPEELHATFASFVKHHNAAEAQKRG